MPGVSFIIPAHNEERNLPATLGAIRSAIDALSLDAEIIVADDASTDRTPEIAREAGAIVVRHERRQISATRNLGARAASGSILFFIDADTQINAQAVRESIDAVKAGAIGGGAMVTFDGWVPRYARLLLAVLVMSFRRMKLCGGAFLFCRREALERAGWWDESVYAGEEILLASALKKLGRFVIVRSTVVTSGRKLRTHSAWEIFAPLWRAPFMGRRFYGDRTHLGLWYDPRREDPHGPSGAR